MFKMCMRINTELMSVTMIKQKEQPPVQSVEGHTPLTIEDVQHTSRSQAPNICKKPQRKPLH